MKSTFKILFYVRKNYVNKNGTAGIMIRITLDGEISQFSSKLEVDPTLWDTKNAKVVGKTMQANKLNALLDNMKASLMNHYRTIEEYEACVTAEKVRNSFLGLVTKQQSLLEVFKQHNDDARTLVGISKTAATMQKYDVTYKRVENFMKYKYNISDIALKEINYNFIKDFENYLMTICSCNSNTTAKFIQFFRRIIIIAKNNGWIHADPFANYTIKLKRVDRGYLNEQEIDAIMAKEFVSERLGQVRDIFVFSIYTGLAYIDVKNLTEENIRQGFDGNLWVMTKRQKTDIAVNVPLLDIPKNILSKYKGKLPKGVLLPVLSNQKTNSYLKEIGDVCGINKNLTFHLARHTFATTTTLAKGVPIETVSKMLGHTNIQTTQIYARITNSKISNDMADLALKINDRKVVQTY